MNQPVYTINLPNRVLSYHQFGASDGFPLLYFHDFPATGKEAVYIDQAAQDLGWRVIAPNRPGLGDSSMSPNRQITQWPHDVEILLDRLNIGRFAVLGFGYGAPYAWVCGATMTKRIAALGVVSAATPALNHFVATAKAFTQLARLPLIKYQFSDPVSAERIWQQRFTKTCALERRSGFDSDFRRARMAAMTDAVLDGTGGLAKDYALVTGARWGFAFSNVTVKPNFVWHGDADASTTMAQLRLVTELIPHAEVTVFPEEGHYSTWVNHHREILEKLRTAVEA